MHEKINIFLWIQKLQAEIIDFSLQFFSSLLSQTMRARLHNTSRMIFVSINTFILTHTLHPDLFIIIVAFQNTNQRIRQERNAFLM